MPAFCRLLDPDRYIGCPWDLVADEDLRAYEIEFFKRQLRTILAAGVESADGDPTASDRARRCVELLDARLDAFSSSPSSFGPVSIITFDRWRDRILRDNGFADPFRDIKRRENQRMLDLLPGVCRQIDALSGGAQARAIIEGVFAGNIFDLGVEITARAFLNQGPDFFATRAALAPRPWLIDNYDELERRFLQKIHRKAVFFIDNAGSDFLLGALPMMRWLARRGTRVVLAANELPTLNDMTIHDVNALWPAIVAAEPSLDDLPIVRVSTGTAEPLIDLDNVWPALNDAAADADLVILEGMGRGVESNLNAQFDCDALNIAMVKDAMVAKLLGGKVFDVVCQFRVAESKL